MDAALAGKGSTPGSEHLRRNSSGVHKSVMASPAVLALAEGWKHLEKVALCPSLCAEGACGAWQGSLGSRDVPRLLTLGSVAILVLQGGAVPAPWVQEGHRAGTARL